MLFGCQSERKSSDPFTVLYAQVKKYPLIFPTASPFSWWPVETCGRVFSNLYIISALAGTRAV